MGVLDVLLVVCVRETANSRIWIQVGGKDLVLFIVLYCGAGKLSWDMPVIRSVAASVYCYISLNIKNLRVPKSLRSQGKIYNVV